MPELAFSHMAIACTDPARSERFYARNFDFRRARVIGNGPNQVVFLKRDDLYLEIFQATQERPLPRPEQAGPEYPAWRHLAFIVDDVDAKLAALGNEAEITLGPLNFDAIIPGWRTAWIADPDGNIIEISQGYVDQENPPPLQGQQTTEE